MPLEPQMPTTYAVAAAMPVNREVRSERTEVLAEGAVTEALPDQPAPRQFRAQALGDEGGVGAAGRLRKEHEPVAADVVHRLLHLVGDGDRRADQFHRLDPHLGGGLADRTPAEGLLPQRELALVAVCGHI